MAKDRKKLIHIHSSVNDKQPTPATLEIGELGVNNAKGNAFISTKNNDGEVVRFSEDETIVGWMEKKEVLPYEAYVRGADNSQIGMVTEQDLLNNKSNIIIKLNQVVPEYTPYDEKVNGAKDIYGNSINPTSDSGYTDGAGIAIDMSLYTMNGSNPSFSSITTTCHTTLNGTTEIKGTNDSCGSEFNVDVENVCIDASDKLNLYGLNTNVGINCDSSATATTTTIKGQTVCEYADDKINVCGVNTTNIGIDCGGTVTNNTTINGTSFVTINSPITNITGGTIISGNTTIGGTLIIKNGLEKSLSWSYGDVTSEDSGSTNFKEDKSFVIPQCAGDINRRTLSWSNGNANTGSYDPGASCDNTDSGTNIVIPSGLSHLTDWSDNCLNVDNNICVIGKVTARDGFFQTSDRNVKENIEKINHNKTTGARRVPIWKFNYKDDETHRDVYGVIAQEAEANGLDELVYTDENGKKSVDYTSLMILKISYLENENSRLRQELSNLSKRVSNLEK